MLALTRFTVGFIPEVRPRHTFPEKPRNAKKAQKTLEWSTIFALLLKLTVFENREVLASSGISTRE